MQDAQRVYEVPTIPGRARDTHKGTYGRVLVVAGSRGMSGAAILCGTAALRSGAGLVAVATPSEIQGVVAAGHPCYTTVGIPQHADSTFAHDVAYRLQPAVDVADALAIGPGLGNRPDVGDLVNTLLANTDKPTVLDADGLNVLNQTARALAARTQPLIMTPHPGEFARLTGRSIAEVQPQREQRACEFAQQWRCIVVLKGHQTIVTDGTRLYINTTGNPGMATGGTGDVLTGLIAALLGQGWSGFDAAVLGTFVHGRAGDLAAATVGEISLTALDVLAALPEAFQERVAAGKSRVSG